VIGSDGSHLPLYDSDRLNFGSQNEASLLFLPLALLVLIAHVILGLQLASFVRTIFMKHKPIPEEGCAEFYSWRSHSQTSWTLPSGSENETVGIPCTTTFSLGHHTYALHWQLKLCMPSHYIV